MPKSTFSSTIRAGEAYSKGELLLRFGISQKFWDQMLDDGLPYVQVGKGRWVIGDDVLAYLRRKAVRKNTNSEGASEDTPHE